jgi:glycosyltransferase involved in cell wall biosynthesis
MSKVAVYMPAYNVGRYIRESLQSVIDQSFEDWRLLVHDDHSDDNTFECALMFDDTRVNAYKRQEHCGLIGKMKNETIAMLGDSEYLCHVGSDDIIPPYCFQMFTEYMDAHPDVGACCGSFVCFNDEGKQWTLPHVSNSGNYDPKILLRYMCLFPMRFYRRAAVEKVGGYSDELSSAVDYDLALRLDEITKIHRIKDPVTYYYRQHPGQVSANARKQQDLNAKKALEAALKRRGLSGTITNDAPPFTIAAQQPTGAQFIWGKK